MAYQANIPTASQRLADSQADLLGNFQAIKQLIDVNHDTFGSPTEGKHKFVSFPDQVASPTVAADEVALFGRLSTLTNTSELCIRKESNGAVYEFTSAGATTNGWTRLPSGILLKWGGQAGVNGLTTITFPAGATIPAFTSNFMVSVTTSYNSPTNDGPPNGFIRLVDWSTASFRIFASNRSSTGAQTLGLTYFAIGI